MTDNQTPTIPPSPEPLFTPGEWAWEMQDMGNGQYGIIVFPKEAAHPKIILPGKFGGIPSIGIVTFYKDMPMTAANARLIVSAPGLYKLVKVLQESIKNPAPDSVEFKIKEICGKVFDYIDTNPKPEIAA